MDITPPRDSSGTDALKAVNARRRVEQPHQVTPTRPLPPTEEWHEQRPQVDRRRSGDRRKRRERRQNDDDDAMLDTRTHRERRKLLRRSEDRAALDAANADAAGDEPIGPRGVDTYA